MFWERGRINLFAVLMGHSITSRRSLCALLIVQRLEKRFIDVAPTPLFARLKRLDDGVLGCMEMLCRVLILRLVAAADVSAAFTQTQVHPRVSDFQTVHAAFSTRRHVPDLIEMRTFSCRH